MIQVAASKAFSITFNVFVISASLKCLFVVPRLSHESTSSLEELLEVFYRRDVENHRFTEVPSASALQVLRRLGSIFTSVYAAVQKLKKDSWLELQFSLAKNSKLNVVYLLNRS
ncbi:hypothetical protein Tco_1061624 [Tanacetum coccineum]